MTDQLTDQRGFDKSPRELWAEWQKTKYSDADVLNSINNGRFGEAQAMIAYNEMIDERIERARRTWGMK